MSSTPSLIIGVKENDVERTRHGGKRVWVGLTQGNYDRPYDVGEWCKDYEPNDAFFNYGHRLRVFHIVENGARVGGVAVRERKGLKDLMALYPATEDGARQFLVRYKRDYRAHEDTLMRVVYVPPENIITTELRVKRAVRQDCYWFGYSSRAITMSGKATLVQHEEYVFSPKRTDRTPVLVPVEFRKNRPRATFVVPNWSGWDERENVSFVFLDKDGKEVEGRFGLSTYTEIVAQWYYACAKDTRGWVVEEAGLVSITGSRHEMTEGPWFFETVLPRLPPRVPDDAEGRDFKEQLVMKAFHPDIVSKRLLEYGDDWLDRV
jgi:hypothetical protein